MCRGAFILAVVSFFEGEELAIGYDEMVQDLDSRVSPACARRLVSSMSS